MKPLRYNYVSDLSETHPFTNPQTFKYESVGRYNSRLSMKELNLSPDALSPDYDEYLHVVEVTQTKKGQVTYEIILRVITKMHRGINIHIPCYTNEMYEKYLDLRYQVRNRDYVLVTFPYIKIRSSSRERELYAYTSDFKVYDPDAQEPDIKDEEIYYPFD